jgi:hypothetical protein
METPDRLRVIQPSAPISADERSHSMSLALDWRGARRITQPHEHELHARQRGATGRGSDLLPMNSSRPLALLAAFTAAVSGIAALAATQSQTRSGWVSLFNGRNLDNWTVEGGSATYRMENDTIVGRTTDGSRNTFLCTKRDYADFELELDVLCDRELNSGIQIRSHVYERDTPQASKKQRIRQKGEVYGYQCEIAPAEKCVSGNFWDEGRWTKWHDDLTNKPGACAAFKDGQWNHYRIVAQGDRIRSWVNGVPCADFRDSMDATGFIGLQVHGIPAGKGPYEVRWRNVRIRELSPGEIVR